MEIYETDVFGLNESIIASGFAKNAERRPTVKRRATIVDMNRVRTLFHAKAGSGHDCALKGIVVQFNMTASLDVWREAERYHWLDIVTSQSTMHCLGDWLDPGSPGRREGMDLDPRQMDVAWEAYLTYMNDPTKANFNKAKRRVPEGLEITARMTTNYMQIKTVRNQRKGHMLEFWTDVFMPWTDTLPKFNELVVSYL